MSTRGRGSLVRVVVIALALVASVALLRRVPEPERGPVAASSSASPSTVATSRTGPGSPAPSGSLPPQAVSATPPGEAWHATARAFVTAYGTTTGGHRAWLARLQPLVSAEVYRGLQQTDLGRLPGGRPGPGRVVVADEFAGGTMRVPLTGGAVWGVDVTVAVAADGREVVTKVLPVGSAGAEP